ncbi:MAG: hypothetical protein R3B70_12360 [Polyangiaceae bacterium]
MLASREVFRAFAAHDFTAFLAANEHADLDALARGLPLAVQAHGLELRLSGGDEHADYLVCLDDEPETVASVRALSEKKRSDGAPLTRVDAYLDAWSAAASQQRPAFPQLWLEWDRPRGQGLSDPGVFLAPASSEPPPAIREQHAGPESEPSPAIREPREGPRSGPAPQGFLSRALGVALRILYSEATAQRHEATIARVRGLLPPGARLRHIGAMPGRSPEFLRLVLEDVSPERLIPLLRSLDWPGDTGALEGLLSEVAERTSCIPSLVDLDFLEKPSPALGLELLLVGNRRPEDGGARLLEALVEKGWASAEKARALAGWLRWEVRDTPGERALWGKLYHIKLSLSGGGAGGAGDARGAVGAGDSGGAGGAGNAGDSAVRAKAYIGFFGGPSARSVAMVHGALREKAGLTATAPGDS